MRLNPWLVILVTQETCRETEAESELIWCVHAFHTVTNSAIISWWERQRSCLLMQHERHRRPLERFASERSASLLGKPDGWRLGCRQRGRSRARWRPPALVSSRNYQLLESCFINRANHAASPPPRQQPAIPRPALPHPAELPVWRLWVGGALLPER